MIGLCLGFDLDFKRFHDTNGTILREKMLESRPEDALDSLVLTVETVETERRILKYLTL